MHVLQMLAEINSAGLNGQPLPPDIQQLLPTLQQPGQDLLNAHYATANAVFLSAHPADPTS